MPNSSLNSSSRSLATRKSASYRCLTVVFAMLGGLAFANMARAEAIYVFGDSLSDTGNLASVTSDFPNPPFSGNRVTDGDTAVEVLADLRGVALEASLHLVGPAQGTNYAVAGAKAGTDEPIDLNTQVDAFLLNTQGQAPADALYVVFIGGNDVRAARDEPNHRASSELLKAALDGVKTNVEKLIAAGAEQVVVVNVPDIGAIPETSQLAATTSNWFLPTSATVKTAAYNLGLKQRVKSLEKASGKDIVLIDLFSAFRSIDKDAEAYGISNTTEPCFSQATRSYTEGCAFGQNISSYAYFDEVHPTAKLHERGGRLLFAYAP
ncbi:SGNH/GDSL hydrolase family protein [Allohahella sp. A8]|uniref:SGNH/GDSL hydrolase family protein n=1 Tax=Allohahella sp. A8 TaxID=3141461 RepID=UPI003A809FAB